MDLKVVEKLSGANAWAYEDILYNQALFQEINNDLPTFHYYLVDAIGAVQGHVLFNLNEGVAHSHASSPFGAFTFSTLVNDESKLFFVVEVERRLKQKGVSETVLHFCPENIQNNQSFLESLCFFGYEKLRERIYQVISCEKDDFETGLHQMEMRKLKKAEEAGFSFEIVEAKEGKTIFDFILEQRTLSGYGFSMDWEALKEYSKSFPKNYYTACLKDGKDIIAATILIKESQSSFYNFAPAHLKKYNKYSPVVLLTKTLFNWGKTSGALWLNLGTSYLGEEQNISLFDFKKHLGAESHVATSLQKVINS